MPSAAPYRNQPALFTSLSGLALGWLATFGLAAPAQAGVDDKSITPLTSSQVEKPESFWSQQYMLGDWGGERTRLEEQGVKFDFNDIGDMLSNIAPGGSPARRVTYFGRFRAGVDLDLMKLAGIDAEFYATAIYQYGRNLSGDYLHTNTLTSSIAGEESYRLDQFWWKQYLFDHKMAITLGQVAMVNEFGGTDFFDILFNDELGYAPNALFGTRQSFSPAGKPGAIVWGDLGVITPGLYTKVGIGTDAPNPYRPDKDGLDYNDDFDHGTTLSYELGYKEQKTVYDGVYKIGANFDSGTTYVNPATGQNYHNNYNVYGIVEKTVYHPVGSDGKLDTKKGLDLLLEGVEAPGDRNALQYEVTLGGRYTGLIPGRDNDKVGFGFIYSDNSDSVADASQNAGGPDLIGEETLELDYQYNPAPWLSIQPDVQYIIDPSGIQKRANFVVLGLRTIVHF